MTYLIAAIIVIAFIVVLYFLAKNDQKVLDEALSNLTEKPKNKLKNTEVQFVEKNAWVQMQMIANIKQKNYVELIFSQKVIGII